jgi:hypothetical protein
MLDATRARCERLGLNNVRCVEAGFLTYEHEGAPPHGVYSRNAVHHLPDFWEAVALERIACDPRRRGRAVADVRGVHLRADLNGEAAPYRGQLLSVL